MTHRTRFGNKDRVLDVVDFVDTADSCVNPHEFAAAISNRRSLDPRVVDFSRCCYNTLHFIAELEERLMHIGMVTKPGRPVPSYSAQTPEKLYQELWGFVMIFLTVVAIWPRNKATAAPDTE